MDRLWSPWRYRYVSRTADSEGCVFCKKPSESDENGLILFRARLNFVILNLFPYTTGHLMVVPYEHCAALENLGEETSVEMMALTRRAVKCLKQVYRPAGLNVGMNLGECAGAGIAEHLHIGFKTVQGYTARIKEKLNLANINELMREAIRWHESWEKSDKNV